ncbi:HAMP domain-containing sensor histidine kinase [Sphingomonas sp. BGYR3]|uniref:ATP-binding protein n=1 Tax=Sphingomonas sp. BGYR3 TaxID=2975483 RepID=UPI0021A29E3D|nr:HAMP domain-containing sensor histidine kinase [Sphingomonas sp. BGYR3]MDG5488806.1 HAMP domain-containing sensor histidine kinase [Sphingomonas sp. BGYR3]
MTIIRAGTAPHDIREWAHDLRNLFGAIASARHLLEDGPDDTRRRQILDAIEAAAARGGAIVTNLLAAASEPPPETFGLRARILLLEPLLHMIAGRGNRLILDLVDDDSLIEAVQSRFDGLMIELVANARAAMSRPGSIRIRLRVRQGHIRLLVLDSGCGMVGEVRCNLLTQLPTLGAHGTGFQQVRRFVEDMHGRLRLRSSPGAGTLIAIDLPAWSSPARWSKDPLARDRAQMDIPGYQTGECSNR